MSKYRPESVISIVASIMEKLMDNQNYEYLMNSNLLTNSEHSFRRNHSTVTALLNVTNRWYQNTDIGQLNGVPFRDLQKHSTLLITDDIILRKQDIYGIRGSILSWINSYLTGRTRYFRADGH